MFWLSFYTIKIGVHSHIKIVISVSEKEAISFSYITSIDQGKNGI